MADNIGYAPDCGEKSGNRTHTPGGENGLSHATVENMGYQEAEQKMKMMDQEPLKFCKLIAKRPGMWFGKFS